MSIDQRLQQLYAALAEMRIVDGLNSIKPVIKTVGNQQTISIDLSGGMSPATAANRVSTLLNNIASLKDHLKVWCKRNGKTFTGDQLIDSNLNVAIIHDLWNLDKHAELNRPSRSGLDPRLSEPPRVVLAIKSEPGAPASVTIPFSGGRTEAQGNVKLQVAANVVDRDGKPLGDLDTISLRAVAAWEAEFVKAGLKLTPQPERQREYARLSSQLQSVGLRYKNELPNGSRSLLMKIGDDGTIVVEVYDGMGNKIDEIPNAKTSTELRDLLQKTFRFAISPDHDGIIAIIE